VEVSQKVLGSGMGAFSIFPSSKLVHLDLKLTSDLVRMRRHSGDRPKLGGAVAFSMHCTTEETLALSGNGSKWRPLGRGSALYNRGPVSQRATTPRGLSGVNHDDPTVWRPQRIYCLLTVKLRQPSHEFTFGVDMSFILYPLVITPFV
jgi:hypothetical protein